MDISLIVCTYNRDKQLDIMLQHSLELIVDNKISFEIIIVDNNSDDDTKNIVLKYKEILPNIYKYAFEGIQGKSFALNRGISEAKGHIIAFTDDDVVLTKGWIKAIIMEFYNDKGLYGIGGRVELYDEKDKPVSIRTSNKKIVVTRETVNPSCIPIMGCNMAYRRIVFENVGKFDTDLGPGGRFGAPSEDLDFLYRVCKSGFKVIYSPHMLVYHNHGRTSDTEIERLGETYVRARGVFYGKHVLKLDYVVLKMMMWDIRSIIKDMFGCMYSFKSVRMHTKYIRDLFHGFFMKFNVFN